MHSACGTMASSAHAPTPCSMARPVDTVDCFANQWGLFMMPSVASSCAQMQPALHAQHLFWWCVTSTAFARLQTATLLCSLHPASCASAQGIPGSVLANMDRVRILDISNNRFEELPASVDGMDTLERLIAAANIIATIDCQLGQLKKLKVRAPSCRRGKRGVHAESLWPTSTGPAVPSLLCTNEDRKRRHLRTLQARLKFAQAQL